MKDSSKEKNFYKQFVAETGTGRYGIIIIEHGYTEYGIIEFREIATAKEYTKIQIMKIYPHQNYKEGDVLEKYNYSEWVPTKYIKWFDDNHSRLRDEKLKAIIEKDGN